MSGKPVQSSLIPYQNDIAALRSSRPPVSYARIADLLRQKYGLNIQRADIAKFVKVRSGGRRVYFFLKEMANRKKSQAQTATLTAQPGQGGGTLQTASANSEQQQPRPKFDFTPSERYNLKRLPKEVADAIRKKLEAEGH